MPLIATQNMKKRDMFNMMEFTLDDIIGGRQTFNFSDSSDEDDTLYVYNENGLKQLRFVVNKEDFDYNEFRESFLPNFCNTVYKDQGGKIDEHYNIWDTHKMDIKEMYRSLSRTTKLEYILNSFFKAYYQNGKIYHVTFENNDKHYVGSTTRILKDRLDEHKLNQKSAIYKFRDDNPIIELICNCPCKD